MPVISHDLVQIRTSNSTDSIRARRDNSADVEELYLALDSSRREIEALVHQNEKLLHTDTLLTKRLSLLEPELAKANQLAHYDELTGLPNRRLLLDRFNQASALADRHDQSLALLFFDLDKFKSVNDNLGHEAGDKLLQQVANRLTNAIRRSDTACRYGGDEFVLLVTEIASREHAVIALQKIRAALAVPYVIDRHSIRMTVSNGIAIYPQDARPFSDLMRLSDRLMLRNKNGSHERSDALSMLNIWLHGTGNAPKPTF